MWQGCTQGCLHGSKSWQRAGLKWSDYNHIRLHKIAASVHLNIHTIQNELVCFNLRNINCSGFLVYVTMWSVWQQCVDKPCFGSNQIWIFSQYAINNYSVSKTCSSKSYLGFLHESRFRKTETTKRSISRGTDPWNIFDINWQVHARREYRLSETEISWFRRQLWSEGQGCLFVKKACQLVKTLCRNLLRKDPWNF